MNPQVISKALPMRILHRDTNVAELYVQDKIERRASWCLLRGLISALQALVGPDGLRRS